MEEGEELKIECPECLNYMVELQEKEGAKCMICGYEETINNETYLS